MIPIGVSGRYGDSLSHGRVRVEKNSTSQGWNKVTTPTGYRIWKRFGNTRQNKNGAGDEARTRDIFLGKEAFYH